MNKVMILGTFHFGSTDDIKQSNNKAAKNDEAIEDFVSRLSEYNPTKICVEWEKTEQRILDGRFRDYNRTKKPATHNEIDKIALPLASRVGLDKINAIDWMERGAAKIGCGDAYDYIVEKEPELHKILDKYDPVAPDYINNSLREAYLFYNSSEYCESQRAYYTNFARSGTNDNYHGMQWLIWWYQRNLNIFSNIMDIIKDSKDERVFVLIGAAHKGILEELFKDSKAVEIVNVEKYI